MLGAAQVVDNSFYPMVVATCVMWILQRRCVEGVGFVIVIAMVLAIKQLVPRMRPDGTTPDSFPSGHASIAFYLAIAGVFPAPLMVTWASLVAWSRVQLRRHNPSDVMVGLAIGSSAALIVRRFITWKATNV